MTVSLTLWRLKYDLPRFWWPTSCQRKLPYCSYTGASSLRFFFAFLMQSAVARCPQASAAGFTGMMKKITYETIVITMKSTQAQSIRRIRYWIISG